MLEVKLVVVGGDAKSSEVRLKLPTVIGRGKEAGLTVPHALVSRRHTEVFERDGKLFVRDLGSLNGTFVNNLKIEGETMLGPNQLLTLGNVTFRAVYEVSADALDASANSETVSFDEVKTEEVAPKVEMKKTASKAVAGAIDINETVPVDDLKLAAGSKQKKASAKKASAKKVDLNPAKKAAKESAPVAKPKLADSSKAKVEVDIEQIELDKSKKVAAASDTDKSFKSGDSLDSGEESISSIFSFDEDAAKSDQSVALSALGDLPSAAKPAVSFVGNVDLGEDAKPAASQIDSVEIDLGVEEKPAQDDDDSGLGSFLNKLPR